MKQTKKISRESTNFFSSMIELQLEYFKKFREDKNNKWTHFLKYYQFMVQQLMSESNFYIGRECRGLLIYHEMGMGKTMLAIAVAMATWDIRQPIVIAPKKFPCNPFGAMTMATWDIRQPIVIATDQVGEQFIECPKKGREDHVRRPGWDEKKKTCCEDLPNATRHDTSLEHDG